MDRQYEVLRAALISLEGGCPPDPGAYFCRRAEDPDEDICSRCWECYLRAVADGVDPAKAAERIAHTSIID